MFRRVLIATAVVALAAPAAASAGRYPPPGDPGTVAGHPKGKVTLRVCATGRTGKLRYRSIQKAVAFARTGDTIRVCDGVYREQVRIEGRGKRDLKLIGNLRRPRRVVIDGRLGRGRQAQDGVRINGADDVTVRGFYARNYKGNGFFAVNVTGYELKNLVAGHGGTYGLYAFNSRGGTMEDSEAFYNNDSGFYVGQIPPQRGRPIRTYVRRVKAWGNVIGFSGTNMRYTTITRSDWFNNGIGIVPNALTSEKFYPPEDNAIVDNDVFWNNFNYFRGAPFRLRAGSAGDLAYPVGTGILLFGGQEHQITGNRIYGNYLMGVGAVEQILMTTAGASEFPNARELRRVKAAGVLVGNEIRGNSYGLGGRDLNGRDVVYEGSGRDNCVEEAGPLTSPLGTSSFRPCPYSGPNALDGATRTQLLTFATAPKTDDPPSYEQFWRAKGHPTKRGVTPLETCRSPKGGCAGQPR